MRPKLTIAIPTYNRANKLKECIKRVINYSKDKEVEIFVSDNASSDNTTEVVMDLQKNYPNIMYFRNDKNLGFDGNFLNCFERAKGEYLWLLSDDDILLPGAIETVLAGCSSKPVCMHLNSSNVKSENPVVLGKPRFKEGGLLEYTDKNLFVEKIGIYCTFISSLIFNVDMVINIKNKEQYCNTNLLQSHIYFEIMKNNGKYIINTYNCVAARSNKTVGYDVLQTWVKNYSELMLTTAIKCGFAKERMSEILRKDLSHTVYAFIITFRQTCDYEEAWDRDCVWKYIERYPELINKYKIALNCSIGMLKWLCLKYKIERKIEKLYG